MSTTALESKLDKKIDEIRRRYLKANLFFIKTDLNNADWTARELKRAEWYYKLVFAVCVLVIGSFILDSVLVLDIIPDQRTQSLPVLTLITFALLALLSRYKTKVEMLRNAMFLIGIRSEIRQSNGSIN